jgi:hypothetical protein
MLGLQARNIEEQERLYKNQIRVSYDDDDDDMFPFKCNSLIMYQHLFNVSMINIQPPHNS